MISELPRWLFMSKLCALIGQKPKFDFVSSIDFHFRFIFSKISSYLLRTKNLEIEICPWVGFMCPFCCQISVLCSLSVFFFSLPYIQMPHLLDIISIIHKSYSSHPFCFLHITEQDWR